DFAPGRPELVKTSGVDLPHLTLAIAGRCLGENPGMRGRLRDHRRTRGVVDDPADLSGRGSLIDGHRDSPGCPDGEVSQGPLVACLAHDCDTFSEADPRGHQTLGDGADIREELCIRDINPGARRAFAERHGVWPAGAVARRQVREVPLDLRCDERGNRDVIHERSLEGILVLPRYPNRSRTAQLKPITHLTGGVAPWLGCPEPKGCR